MKRRIFMLALVLVLGAILNVGLAWACAVFIDPSHVEEPVIGLRESGGETWEVMRIDRFGYTSTHMTRAKGWNPGNVSHGPRPDEVVPWWGDLAEPVPRYAELDPAALSTRVRERRWSVAAGWPVRSLWCDTYIEVGTDESFEATGLQGGLDIGLPGWRDSELFPRVLPCRPIWPGFAINTLLYVAIFWFVFVAPFVLRRRWRVRHGRCPACGYPAGESDACTECGRKHC